MMDSGKKVLIVDDEDDFLLMMRDALEIRGMKVAIADNAIEAGVEIARHPPDVILIDIKMPGIDGLEACEAIKRNPATRNLPILIISALSDEAIIKKAYKIGVAGYFVKPINIEKIVNKLNEIFKIG